MTNALRSQSDSPCSFSKIPTGAPPGSWSERWRNLKLAHCAIPNYGNSRVFWSSKKKIDAVYARRNTDHKDITEARLRAMQIPDGSRILDIGAGPGTYAIPLSKRGCPVTVVEPSPVMREMLAARIKKEKIKNINVIPKRWEDVTGPDLGAPFDAVIASFSLTMLDMREALARMNACSKGTVHLYWFLTSPAWAKVSEDLWPLLHGGHFPGEPTADWLWQILIEMGIPAAIQPESEVLLSRYASRDDAVDEFRERLSCTTAAQEEIVKNYFQAVLKEDRDGFVLGTGTRSAHIWWNTKEP